MKVDYRDARPADAAALEGIFDTSFCDTFAHLYRAEDLQDFLSSYGIADWQAQLADPAYAFRIAEVDGRPAGYVKLGPLKLPVGTDRSATLLDQLYILKDYQGIGIAHELMNWAIAEARRRGAEEMYLTVYVDNHRARRVYDRYGFTEVGMYKFMVGSHADDDIIMKLAL